MTDDGLDLPEDDRENPVKTMDLGHDEAHTALVTDRKFDRVHPFIEGYATLYKRLVALEESIDEYRGEAVEVGAQKLTDDLEAKCEKLRQTVLDEYDHALRWTLDAYDELPEDPDDMEEA